MSMSDTACSGYTVKASEFTKVLPEAHQERYTQAITNQDYETVDEILNEHLPAEFPGYESAFVLKSEDTADELEHGVVYVIFQDEDLFVQIPTRSHDLMRAKGITPEFHRWTVWG
jgi:hypothetical protein